MPLQLEQYAAQRARWPRDGRVVLAQFDEESIVVYQAYRPSIGHFAATHGHFGGGGFKLDRMTWIKPNFLWMMYRCGWAQKSGQEVVLGVRLRRVAFDEILRAAVPSTFDPLRYATHEAWKADVARSDVRLQWDPDHTPQGGKVARRAIQLGLRGEAAQRYAREWIVSIDDVTPLVEEQRAAAERGDDAALSIPREIPYPVPHDAARSLGMLESCGESDQGV